MPMDVTRNTQNTTAEALAKRCDPHVWALDPPDISSAGARRSSLIRAKVRLGELWWNMETEEYEAVPGP